MIVYKATSKTSGKVYVGQTQTPLETRIRGHQVSTLVESGFSHFRAALKKYGFEDFIFEVIDEATSLEELNSLEIYWIDYYEATNPLKGYNLTQGGVGGNFYRNLSEEEKRVYSRRLSEAQKESYRNNPQRREAMHRAGLKAQEALKKKREEGWIPAGPSIEARERMSKESRERNLKSGITPPSRKGTSHKDSSKEKMSKASKGKTWEERYGKEYADKKREEARKRFKENNPAKRKKIDEKD